MNNLVLELEYDLIEEKNSNILSSNDIQNDILNLVRLSESDYLCKLIPEKIFLNQEALEKYRELNMLARNIFNYIYGGHYEYLNVMKNLIIFMRDYNGLEKTLVSYCLLDILSEYDVELANKIFCAFVSKYGSWKDLKRFYVYCCCINKEDTSTIIDYSITLANEQLRQDLNNPTNDISNVAKWLPRENFKKKKLYERLVINFFEINKENNLSEFQYKKQLTKAKMNYRKCLSELNRKLDTVQIKQCSKNWQKINPLKQTCRTMELQIGAFLNLKKNNKMRYELSDRIICANNFIDLNDKFINNNNYTNDNECTNDNKFTIKNQFTTFNELLECQNEYSLL